MSEEFKKWSEEFDKKMAKLQARIERLENSMHEDPEKQLKLWHLWNNEKTDENQNHSRTRRFSLFLKPLDHKIFEKYCSLACINFNMN